MVKNEHRVGWYSLGLIGGLVILDQLLKFWVCSHFIMYQIQWGWTDVIGLTRVRNYSLVNELGSRLEDSVRFILLWVIPCSLLTALLGLFSWRWIKRYQSRLDIGLALLFFGGLSNVLPLQGSGVIETLVVQFPLGMRAIFFNLADLMIWVGLAVVVFDMASKFEWSISLTREFGANLNFQKP